jgi:hypothetical protein
MPILRVSPPRRTLRKDDRRPLFRSVRMRFLSWLRSLAVESSSRTAGFSRRSRGSGSLRRDRAGAPVGKLTVDNNGRQTADAVTTGRLRDRGIVHVANFDIVRGARQELDEFHSLASDRATRCKDLDFSPLSHVVVPIRHTVPTYSACNSTGIAASAIVDACGIYCISLLNCLAVSLRLPATAAKCLGRYDEQLSAGVTAILRALRWVALAAVSIAAS